MRYLVVFMAALLMGVNGFAQKGKKSKSTRIAAPVVVEPSVPPRNALTSNEPLTWLGLDFTQAAFIGSADQYGGAGAVSDVEFRDKYIPAWNDLFVNETKKYNVAKYLKRDEVSYAVDLTKNNNNRKAPKTYFSDDPGTFHHLDERRIAQLVKGYDFQGKQGTGVLFFVEGMSKGAAKVAVWVAFVDLKSRSLLQSARVEGKPGGFGFRNYWAGGFLNVLKNVRDEMR